MGKPSAPMRAVQRNLRRIREQAGLTSAELEERLILGPGWVEHYENGETVPTVDILMAILSQAGATLADLFSDIPAHQGAHSFDRFLAAEQRDNDLILTFRYSLYDAQYVLEGCTLDEFDEILRILRDTLSRASEVAGDADKAVKREAVTSAFLKAVDLWPHINPSDIWYFVIYRAYCDPFNHPASYARQDLAQSWKRTGGWALEEVLVRHYAPFLERRGIKLFIADVNTRRTLLNEVDTRERMEADKVDVVLCGKESGQYRFFGVVHVKSSFAERRTDDVPMSHALGRAGYTSPLWTMDCKSGPSAQPFNRGELGQAHERRNAKRKDIEDEGFFTGCFSYNKNTAPSDPSLPPTRQIQVCDFSDPDDAFSQFIVDRWQKFRST